MPQTDRSRPVDGRTAHESVSGTTWSVPLGPTRLLVAGEWITREPDWRDQVTLQQCQDSGDVPLAYRCGLEDGYHLAISELREFASLLVDRLSIEQAYERAQRQVRRSA